MVAGGFSPVNTGRNYLYVCIIASMGTGYPEDLFTGLPLREQQSCVTLWTLIFSSKRRSKGTAKSSDPTVHATHSNLTDYLPCQGKI